MKGERRDKLKTIVFKLTMPNRILYYPNIVKGERRDKLKTIVFKLTMPNRILYYPNIAKGERRGNNNIQLVLIKKKKDTCNLVYMTTTACIF
ncbi:MAG: hypothetical protein BHV77_15265 [Bacteroides sp. 43_108]|nr:MAG: hypothetical protein BHV77_15265 [Bacteroides sp. 43_108]